MKKSLREEYEKKEIYSKIGQLQVDFKKNGMISRDERYTMLQEEDLIRMQYNDLSVAIKSMKLSLVVLLFFHWF